MTHLAAPKDLNNAEGKLDFARLVASLPGFQFIGFPNEWGEGKTTIKISPEEIVFPIYWVPQRVGS